MKNYLIGYSSCIGITLVLYHFFSFGAIELIPFLLNLVAGFLLGKICIYFIFQKKKAYQILGFGTFLILGMGILISVVTFELYPKTSSWILNNLTISFLFQLLSFSKLLFFALLYSIFD